MNAVPRKPVWLDCDPGHDDAMAIILAGHTDSLQLLGISTVAGNQTVELVTDNALRVLTACGLAHIPVVAGARKPLLRPALLCPEIHGKSGLDGPLGGHLLPPPAAAATQGSAPVIMFDTISACFRDRAERVHLVATAALTNVALFLAVFPEAVEMVQVVVMGGCLGVGNTHPVAEFNIQTDPEAAKLVFESGVPLTMVPLDVTHSALVTPQVLQRILSPRPTPFLEQMASLLLFFSTTYKEVFQFENPPLHDPCAVAFVIAPELFQVERLRVDVETCSQLTAGQTVVDVWRQSQRPPNVDVCKGMDVARFWDLMVAALHKASALMSHDARHA